MACDPGDTPDLTAAELVLGLLEAEERAIALRRILAEPDFALEVEMWRTRLEGLYVDYPEAAAPAGVIESILDRPRPTRFLWPIVSGLLAVAAAFAFFLLSRTPPPPPPVITPQHEYLVASLLLADKSKAVSALIDTTDGKASVAAGGLAPTGKTAQLWLIGSDGVPQSLGLLSRVGQSKITLPDDRDIRFAPGVTLAVSIEPAGGSPTGKPTGPVVASGKLDKV